MMNSTYSVTEINNYIKRMFAQDFLLNRVTVKGEISNLKLHSSGHIYFTLKDDGGALSAIMFAGYACALSFNLKEGMKVSATGNIDIYEKTGAYQLYVKSMEEDGEGLLYKKYLELKQKLEDMGMFEQEYKKPIPKYIKTLGVVTSPTGAAIRDIENITGRRNPYVQIILSPALVQGEGAAASIKTAIERLIPYNPDVIIVGRGGGSIEDLWPFNEEEVAKAIFASPIPIISAVGHETDTTIADYVADMRAPTPSAAAELAVYSIEDLDDEIEGLREDIISIFENRLDRVKMLAENYRLSLLKLSPDNILLTKRHALADLEDELKTLIKERVENVKDLMSGYGEELLSLIKDKFKDTKNKTVLLATTLDELSPLKKMAEGYTYTEKTDGAHIHSIKDVKYGDELKVHFKDGFAGVTVHDTEEVTR